MTVIIGCRSGMTSLGAKQSDSFRSAPFVTLGKVDLSLALSHSRKSSSPTSQCTSLVLISRVSLQSFFLSDPGTSTFPGSCRLFSYTILYHLLCTFEGTRPPSLPKPTQNRGFLDTPTTLGKSSGAATVSDHVKCHHTRFDLQAPLPFLPWPILTWQSVATISMHPCLCLTAGSPLVSL